MRRLIASILVLAALAACLAIVPAASCADELYIIPDSNTRKLTYDELLEYKYDTLLYAFNEIYARHGYKFETGSRCYNWFTQMPWYSPNMNESSKDHSTTYRQCSEIENYNVDLIKQVRADMRADKSLIPKNGKGMPTPPKDVDKPRGFDYIELQRDQQFDVYTAPSVYSYRAVNSKGKPAKMSSNGAVYALGWDQGWMLILYEANVSGQFRVGYIDGSKIKGKVPSLDMLSWDYSRCEVLVSTTLTDDPALTGKTLTQLPAGTTVTYLTTMYNSEAWDYVETTIEGKTARGFVPSGTLSITGVDLTEHGAPLGDG